MCSFVPTLFFNSGPQSDQGSKLVDIYPDFYSPSTDGIWIWVSLVCALPISRSLCLPVPSSLSFHSNLFCCHCLPFPPPFFLAYLLFFSLTSVSLPLLLWFCLSSTKRWKGSVRWCVRLLSFPFLPQHHCMLIFAAVIIWKSFSSPMWVSLAWLPCTSVEQRFSAMPLLFCIHLSCTKWGVTILSLL